MVLLADWTFCKEGIATTPARLLALPPFRKERERASVFVLPALIPQQTPFANVPRCASVPRCANVPVRPTPVASACHDRPPPTHWTRACASAPAPARQSGPPAALPRP
eukprot:353784-Chlamydomonas_euryale.AAC.2